jgi:hypothetical protein
MTLEERIYEFSSECFKVLYNEDEGIRIDFTDYWTEHSPGAKKARWEKEKVFDIKRRFATWKRNNEKWNVNNKPKFMEKVIDKQNNLEELFNLIDKKHGTN